MDDDSYTAVLARVPDGRRGTMPLFSPVLLGYLALFLGAPLAAACAGYNALVLRRARPLLAALAVGTLGWFAFGWLLNLLWSRGARNFALLLLAGRLLHLALGCLLAWSQWAHFRGHRFLDGREVPLLPAVLCAMALTVLVPPLVILAMMGLPLRG